MRIYLIYGKSLSIDSNFTGQAAWFLAGGTSSAINHIEALTRGEIRRLIEHANKTQPYPPEWGCDGIHCAGNDIRYAGMWDRDVGGMSTVQFLQES